MIRQFSAGGVVYKKEGTDIYFLLRKSTPSPHYPGAGEWSLPKGWLDDTENDQPGPRTLGKKRATEAEIQSAALKEVGEETGVTARIISRLPNIQFFFVNENKEKVLKTVMFYLMCFEKDLKEAFGPETSEIKWVTADDSRILLKHRRGEAGLISASLKLI